MKGSETGSAAIAKKEFAGFHLHGVMKMNHICWNLD